MANPKILFLDMEGTLFEKQRVAYPDGSVHNTLWARLMAELGTEALQADIDSFKKWESGFYKNYMDWSRHCVEILKRFGLSKAQFYETIHSVQFSDGVRVVMGTVNDLGIITVLISGGFIEQARKAQMELRLTHTHAAVELFWDDAGKIEHWNLYPSDFEGKVDFMKLMIREYGVSPADCWFVGDGANDSALAKEVGKSFAYQGHEKLVAAASHSIESFSELSQFFEFER